MQKTTSPLTLKTILSIGFILLLIAGTGIAMVLSRLNQDNRQQASVGTGTATITLSNAGGTIAGGQANTVDVMFNSQGASVDGVQFEANFTGTVPADLTFTPASVAGLTTAVQTMTQPTATTRKLLFLAHVPAGGGQSFTTNGQAVKLGSLSYTAPITGELKIDFVPSGTIAVDTTKGTDVMKQPAQVAYQFAEPHLPPTGTNTAKLYFSTPTPANPQSVGRNFTVDVMAALGANQVSGIDAKISYDPTAVRVVSVVKSAASPFTSYPSLVDVNGTISISGNVGVGATASPAMGTVNVARITFTPLKAISATSLSYLFTAGNRNDSNVVTMVQSGQESSDILAEVTNFSFPISTPAASATPIASALPTPVPTPIASALPTPQPSATPIPSPIVARSVNIKLSVQGKKTANVRPYQFVLDTRLANATSNIPKTVATIRANEGNVVLPPGNYSFLVKVPGYLAKKFGTSQSAIPVLASTTQLDFSNYTLLGGDFNADGIVNEVDYTLFFLKNFKTNHPMVDLDESGEVNNLDFAIMRSNWLLRADTLP